MYKRCSKCNTKKTLSEFYNDKRYKDGKYPSCKSCCKIATEKSIIKKWGSKNNYYVDYRNKQLGMNPRVIYSKKKHNALSHNVPFSIDIDEFEEWYNKQDKVCVYCGIPQGEIANNQDIMPNKNIHRLTIDRMENTGYFIDNICLCCARCNLIKSNIFSFEEMKKIGRDYVRPKWEN